MTALLTRFFFNHFYPTDDTFCDSSFVPFGHKHVGFSKMALRNPILQKEQHI